MHCGRSCTTVRRDLEIRALATLKMEMFADFYPYNYTENVKVKVTDAICL